MNFKTQSSIWRISLVLGTIATGGIVLAQTGGETAPTGQPSGSPSEAPSPSPSVSAQPQLTTQREVYEALLTPVNGSVSNSTASVRVVVDQGQVGFYIQGANFDTGVVHMQNIHSGTSCATLANDSNGDGIIDNVESDKVSGAPAFPLTLNLVRPLISAATNDYPVSSADGTYEYIASTTVPVLQSALGPMPSSTTTMGASPSPTTGASGLALEGRVIEIYGVNSDAHLPSTVQPRAGMSADNSLPVACGTITRTTP